MKATDSDSGIKEASAAADVKGQMEATPRPWYFTPRDTPNQTRDNFVQSLCIESDAGFVLRVSDLGHAQTEPQRLTDAKFVLRAANNFDALLAALKYANRFLRKQDVDKEFIEAAIANAEKASSVPNGNDSSSASSSPKSASIPTTGTNQ